jgi:glycosyltransferase involved in cell wall biosynthesis
LDRLLAGQVFDVVVLEHLFLAELADTVKDTPVILVEHNIESEIARRRYETTTRLLHRFRNRLQWQKLLAFERNWLRRFLVCVTVSDLDAAHVQQLSPGTEVYVVPNGVDCTYFAPPEHDRAEDTVLFFGTLSYQPNTEGLIWFCDKILPRIHAAYPTIKLKIIGANPPERVIALARSPSVEIIGFVPDIRPYLWSASLSIVPLKVGGGTRLKILEALAAQCPVVSTTIGCEGLDLKPDGDLLVADEPRDFAASVVQLLENPDLRLRLACNGQRSVTARYDWAHVVSQLEVACERAIGLHPQ